MCGRPLEWNMTESLNDGETMYRFSIRLSIIMEENWVEEWRQYIYTEIL